jgi:hypothetical protein
MMDGMDTGTLYRLLADLVLFLHAAFVLFVILGQVLIVAGLVARWRWVRNFWFRMGHLAAIALVVGQSWAGVPCPLTILENRLREAGGGDGYPDTFMAYWVHEFLFYEAEPWVFTLCYTLFALAVVACLALGPPRLPWRHAPQPAVACPTPTRPPQ